MPLSSQIQTSDQVSLNVIQFGDPDHPTIVFSNSLGTTWEMWTDQISALKDRFHLVLYDTRGHGDSEAPQGAYSLSRLSLDVLEIMHALEIETANFCGLSLGGMTGQMLAVRAPESFRAFVLAATSAYMGPPAGWQARIQAVQSEGMNAICDAVLEKWFSAEGATSQSASNEAKSWFLSTDPVGYSGCCAAIRDMDLRGFARVISSPTLIIAGENDSATPLNHAEFLNREISGSFLATLAGGHLINLEQPNEFSARLAEFFDVVSSPKY